MIKVNFIFILMLAGIAVVFDFRTFCIPNRLNLIGALAGLSYSAIVYGLSGLARSAIWLVATIGALFVLYAFGVLGAGDVKLYGAIGTFIYSGVLWVVTVSFAAAAAYGAFIVIKRKGRLFKARTRIHMSLSIFLGVLVWGCCFMGGIL